jgi:hypothetical protein
MRPAATGETEDNAMLTRPATRLSAVVADLRDLPDGLATPVNAGLPVADVLRALGWDAGAIARAVGVDLADVEDATVVALA